MGFNDDKHIFNPEDVSAELTCINKPDATVGEIKIKMSLELGFEVPFNINSSKMPFNINSTKMTFNDDEPILAHEVVSAERKPAAVKAGKTQMRMFNKKEAPLEATELRVLLELTESGKNEDRDRPGVDIVAAIDVSGSMDKEGKSEKLKNALQFLIKKLSPIDRLSVVTFADNSKRLFPLRQITEGSQQDIEKQVKDLVANGNTNIADGLKTALRVLNDRRVKDGRVGAILLMSGGAENRGKAAEVDVGNVPVHTFNFSAECEPSVVQEIAKKSNGGTFSDVLNHSNLSAAFSQCLAGLLGVVVQDVKLTVKQFDGDSKIENVYAGDYPQSGNKDSSVTISLGNLYKKEVRKVIVDLILPKVDSQTSPDVIRVSYTYSDVEEKRLYEANPIKATVTRIDTPPRKEKEREELTSEENRVKSANMVNDGKEATYKMVETKNLANPLPIEIVKFAMQLLFKRFADLQSAGSSLRFDMINRKQVGRDPFVLSNLETSSNARKRFAVTNIWTHTSSKPRHWTNAMPPSHSLWWSRQARNCCRLPWSRVVPSLAFIAYTTFRSPYMNHEALKSKGNIITSSRSMLQCVI
ncbi:Uncharacterized protein L484_023909 [Morus notabilis]|uniref:VWFA domain-containing protein n=1 Tax=Morus notabilis TaxID=981085 RepID=W9R5H6_9ROSA|nr:uncharacterized protein LOC21406662 [Morus notabilis]EXB70723.1 Uncharacterized protein L484_023909 [Morus notabilis]